MASLKGFMKGLGKIALQAAPYVAAPFTGGASLYAVPATQKIGQKWAEHDAKENAKKGLAPSKFDKYLGMASNVASLASGTGALGKFGSAAYTGVKAANAANTAKNVAKGASTVKKVADTASTWQNRLKQAGQIGSMMSGSHPNAGMQNYNIPGGYMMDDPRSGGLSGQIGQGMDWMSMMGNQNWNWGGNQQQPQSTNQPQVSGFQGNLGGLAQPRGYNPIEAGRNVAMQNQPWRAGATIQTQGPDDSVITSQTPPIYPQYQAPVQGNLPMQGDMMTPRYGRRRNPAPEEEYQ